MAFDMRRRECTFKDQKAYHERVNRRESERYRVMNITRHAYILDPGGLTNDGCVVVRDAISHRHLQDSGYRQIG